MFWAWLAATLLSGIPSTLYALATARDVMAPTLAAGAMLLPNETSTLKLVLAAAIVHPAVSLFWAAILAFLLPAHRTMLWAIVAAAAIALLDLGVIAPAFFPRVAELDFWPQFADHLMWGATLGLVLQWRKLAQ